LARDGTLYVWGGNSEGQLGLPEVTHLHQPTILTLPETPVKIACGLYISAVVTSSGSLYLWGDSITKLTVVGKRNISGPRISAQTPTCVRENVKEIVCARQQLFVTHVDNSVCFIGRLDGFAKGVQVAESDHGRDNLLGIDKNDIAFIGSCTRMCFVISKKGKLYPIGENCTLAVIATAAEGKLARFPHQWKLPSNVVRGIFWDCLKWIFLGKLDDLSSFFFFPVEIIFHVIQVLHEKRELW
jgi:alpha-tubulin suppressor-like RCC1 family protein